MNRWGLKEGFRAVGRGGPVSAEYLERPRCVEKVAGAGPAWWLLLRWDRGSLDGRAGPLQAAAVCGPAHPGGARRSWLLTAGQAGTQRREPAPLH